MESHNNSQKKPFSVLCVCVCVFSLKSQGVPKINTKAVQIENKKSCKKY